MSSLRESAVASTTLRTYDKNLNNFLQFTRLSFSLFLTFDAQRLDAKLAAYIEHMHATAAPFDYASHAVHGVIFRRPELRGPSSLPISRQCLRGWARTRLTASHPPLTWELTVLFAVNMARSGHHGPAVAILLAFDCYLRVGELTRLRYCDVVQPHDPRLGSGHTTMALRLPKTKTGLNQWVSLQNADVTSILVHWLRQQGHVHDQSSTRRVFPFSPSHLRWLLHRVKEQLGLSATPYVPHSLRHGGATYDYLRGASIEQVMYRGRWQSMVSARRYIQTGRALLVAQQVPQRLNQLGQLFNQSLPAIFVHLMHSVATVQSRAASAALQQRSRSVTFAAADSAPATSSVSQPRGSVAAGSRL